MFRRQLTESLIRSLRDAPVVFLRGARQTGKSTLVQAVAASDHPATYVTLDDLGLLSACRNDPQGFLAGLPRPVVLDEVQRCPDLFLALKAEVDRERTPGRFLLTGSAGIEVLPALAQALVGRVELLTLHTLSQGELRGLREGFVDAVFSDELPAPVDMAAEPADIPSAIVAGGYPEALDRSQGERRNAWYRSYVETLVQRDIRELAHIEGLLLLPDLLRLLAARIGGLSNLAELSRASAITQTTLKRYLALLEGTFLLRRLPAWSSNIGKRLVRSPKVYFHDTGLAAHLRGASTPDSAADPVHRGPLLECFVLGELQKQIDVSMTRPRLYHYRNHSGDEVDFVLEAPDGRCVAIEVKATATPDSRCLLGLRRFAELLGQRFVRGILLTTSEQVVPFGARLHAFPVSALWRLAASPQEPR